MLPISCRSESNMVLCPGVLDIVREVDLLGSVILVVLSDVVSVSESGVSQHLPWE